MVDIPNLNVQFVCCNSGATLFVTSCSNNIEIENCWCFGHDHLIPMSRYLVNYLIKCVHIIMPFFLFCRQKQRQQLNPLPHTPYDDNDERAELLRRMHFAIHSFSLNKYMTFEQNNEHKFYNLSPKWRTDNIE